VAVLAVVAMVALLAALLLPALNMAKRTSSIIGENQFAHGIPGASDRYRSMDSQSENRAKSLSNVTLSGKVDTKPVTDTAIFADNANALGIPSKTPSPVPSVTLPAPPSTTIVLPPPTPEAPVETSPQWTANNMDVGTTTGMPMADNPGNAREAGTRRLYRAQTQGSAFQSRIANNSTSTENSTTTEDLAYQNAQPAAISGVSGGAGGGGGSGGGFGGDGTISGPRAPHSPKDDNFNSTALAPSPASLPLGRFPEDKKTNASADNGDIANYSGFISGDDLAKRKIVTKEVPFVGDVPVEGNLFSSNGAGTRAAASGATFAPRNTSPELAEGDTIIFSTNGLGVTRDVHQKAGEFDSFSGEAQPMTGNKPAPIQYANPKKTDGAITYLDEERKLEQLQEVHKLLYEKIKVETIDSTIPLTSQVQITDPAQPGKSQSWWERLNGEVESTARIRVENDGGIIAGMATPISNQVYDPYFIQTTFEIIQSELVLDKAVDALKLQDAWANKNGGQKLTKEEAVAMLKDRLTLSPVKNTKLIAITVKSDQPAESAKLANAVASAYQDYRAENSKQMAAAGLSALKQNYAEENQSIRALQSKVDRLGGVNGGTMDVNDVISLYAKLSGRTFLRSSIQQPEELPVPNLAAESKDEQIATLQRVLAADNISVVNVGNAFVKVTAANNASASAAAINDQADRPLRKPAPNAPIPQPEVLTTANPFSTFAMNVSDVSFQLAAASLEKGLLPEAASIRSEEFINAFDYRDPEASAGQPIAFNSERAQDPFAQNRDLLRFSIKTAAAGRQPGRPLNLVLLLDNSGSMERADRVAIIRESLRVLASQLEAQDTITVVTFARTARLWLDGVPGNQAGAELEKVGELTPQGGTNLEEAMRLAYEAAHRHYLANGMNRVVLLTDGAANLGTVDATVLTEKVEANRKQGIALDCFGIGWEDFNDDLLEQLSSHGDGRYAFLNSPAQASSEFAAKLAGALQIAAQDVKVQVEFNPNRVTTYRQIGYAKHQLTKEQFRDNSVAAGEIAAAEAGNALYSVELKPDGTGPLATVRLRYRVPGTTDYRERSWNVDYTGNAPALEKSSPAMRLSATAAGFAEWLSTSPFAQQITLDELLNELNGVPAVYGADARPKKLEWMIRQAKSVAGK
jgi:Mg-chelatase subunit ChlD